MNKNMVKGTVEIIIIIATLLILTTNSSATLSVKTSKSSVAPGESFSVTVSVSSNEAGKANLSVSNGTLSSTNIDLMTQSSVTINCTAGNSGTVSINASGLVANYETETEEPHNASASVTIVQPVAPAPTQTTTPQPQSKPATQKVETVTKSSNSKLSSLILAEGAITPEFSSSVKEYAISVPNEITKLSISAIPDSSKATVSITGNEELVEGENNIAIIVTAEDGSKTTYKILVSRAVKELGLEALTVHYIDENGEKVELPLEPLFSYDAYEYELQKLPYSVKKLEIEALPSKENAKVDIIGNEELKAGKNEIEIKVTLKNEDGLEEIKTYKLIVEREEEPVTTPLTAMQKIKKWFNGVGNGLSKWVAGNFDRIVSGMLLIATASFVGLTIYFAYDYKNYQNLLAKLAQYNKENLMERANEALKPEENKFVENKNISEQLEQVIEEQEKQEVKQGKGKRFKQEK